MKNLSISITLVMFFVIVFIVSATATTSPIEKSERIGETDSGVMMANLNNPEINKKNLLINRNITVQTKSQDSAEKTKPNLNRASFPDIPIMILLGIGLFSIVTIRRRAFVR